MQHETTLQPAENECPLHRATRLLGDRWTLLILRDVMFDGHRTFRDLMHNSREGIASNILSSRLKRMVVDGLLTQATDADSRQRKPYALTERAIALVPVMAELWLWGLADTPQPGDLRARLFYGGGPRMWRDFQDELRDEHLRQVPGPTDAIRARLVEAEWQVLQGNGPIAF